MLFCFLILVAPKAAGQHPSESHIDGIVFGVDGQTATPLANAHVYWLGTRDGAITDSEGRFTLTRATHHHRLVISHVSWEPDTIEPGKRHRVEIRLSRIRSSEAVEIAATAPDTYIAAIPQRTEVITAKELEKAACCDLSGCFGTTSSVQADAADVITDMRQLTMLGLGGVYTQILVDNIPAPGDRLGRQFGIQSLPGPWVRNIYVSKGASGVAQGASSVSGLINVMLLEGEGRDQVFFNAFGMNHLEQQYNAWASSSIGQWNTLFALHGTKHGVRRDVNNDGFMDSPLVDRISLLNKWSLVDESAGIVTHTAVKFDWEDRLGGQTNYRPEMHRGTMEYYGQYFETSRIEAYNKTDIRAGDNTVFRTHASVGRQDLDAVYGTTYYDAEQYTAYADFWMMYEGIENYLFTLGTSWSWSELREMIDLGTNPHARSYGGEYVLRESVPGVFLEQKVSMFNDAVSLLTGVRADSHSGYGIVLTPRLFLRYLVDWRTTLRLSAGTGFRTPALFAENAPMFASWRDIIAPLPLKAERAVNYGINLTHFYNLAFLSGTITADMYRTEFTDQIVADYDSDQNAITFVNLTAPSVWNHALLEATVDVGRGLSLRSSYMYTHASEIHGGVETTPPFVSRDRVLAVLTTTPFDYDVAFTVSAEWRGTQRLPATDSYPEDLRLPDRSPAFTLMNAHVNVSFGRIDVYAGAENLLDFRQNSPILNARRPFDRHFEPTFAWGPVKGRELYAGTRVRIGQFNR